MTTTAGFAAALAAVRRWGGVLEHPADSHAWTRFGVLAPPQDGGWIVADWEGGWTCCVSQGHYGHRGKKATWLYACRTTLPSLQWGPCRGERWARVDRSCRSAEERRRAVRTGVCQILSHRQRALTPVPFAEVLLSMARSVR